MKPREAYYTKQKYLFALVLSVVSIVPLLALNYNTSRFYRESWVEKTSLELATLAGDRRAMIDRFLQTQEDQLAGFLSLYDPRTLTEQARMAALFEAMNHTGVITDLGLIDRDGNHRAYHGPFAAELAGKNYARAEWFAEVMKNGRYVSDVFSGYRKVPHLIVAVADPGRNWILRATINSELFNSLVASANVGPAGDAFIVNRRGELQTPSRLGLATVKPESLGFFTRLADAGGKAQPRGELIHCATHLNGGQWLLVLETNMAASLASYDKARRLDTVLVATAALAIVLVAVFLMRSMVGKLERADRERTLLTNQIREVEKLALIGRLSASVAHEINNPLQIITDQAGLMDELMDEEKPDAIIHYTDYRRALGKIHTQIGRTRTITHRLLGFSRPHGFEPAETDINQAVEETVALLEHEAKRHEIVIVRHYQDGLPAAYTDAAQIQQVVLNILHNAMDAIGQNGVIEVTSRLAGEGIVVDFSDNGSGLSAETLAHLYDPFFTTKPKGKGTGLGLFVSREIMATLGGTLTAANRPQGGAVFSVQLPLRPPGGPANPGKESP
jgi:two-component system NtrC family sensor kinase